MSLLRTNATLTREINTTLLDMPLGSASPGQKKPDAYVGVVAACQDDGLITKRQLRKAAERIGPEHLNTKDVLNKALDKVAASKYNEAEVLLYMACDETVVESPAYSKAFLQDCLKIVRLLQEVRDDCDDFFQAKFNLHDSDAGFGFASSHDFMRPQYHEIDLIRLAGDIQVGVIRVLEASKALGESSGQHQAIDQAQAVFKAQALRSANRVDNRYEWRDFESQIKAF